MDAYSRKKEYEKESLLPEDGEKIISSHLRKWKGANQDQAKKWGKRHVLCFLAFLGFVNVYCLRVNLSVALVAMVNSTDSDTNSSDECSASSNSTTDTQEGEFDWDEHLQGIILGSFFYGYIVTQIPGGWMAENFGAKKLFGLGILCTSVLTLLTPVAARWNVYVLIALRIFEGFGEAVTFPAMHAMWGKWAPLWERSRLVSFTYAGANFGTVISLPLSGILINSGFLGGWPSVFYVFGVLGCLWFVVWMIFAHDTPKDHPSISEAEKEYILDSLSEPPSSTPWKSILTSSAVWGIAIGHFANNWGYYTLLTDLPTYMKQILKFNIKQNGFLSAIPYLALWITQILTGILADFLRSNHYLSTQNVRRLMDLTGSVLPAASLIAVGYVGCDHVISVVFLILAVASAGSTTSGYQCSHLDIAPNFAGTLMGISNTLATIPGFIGPLVVGQLTNNNQTVGQWRIVFYISGGVYVVGGLLYCLLIRGTVQPWAEEKVIEKLINSDDDDDDDDGSK